MLNTYIKTGKQMKEKNNRIGYLFILPYLFSFLIFFAYPALYAFYLVFHRWDLITESEFVGLRNFNFLLQDYEFWQAIRNTLFFLIIHIPLQIVTSLVLAIILSKPIKARSFFRASFFLPVIISGAVVTILWQKLYSTDTGIFNVMLNAINLPGVNWLTDPKLAMVSIAVMATWKNVGFYIILFLSGVLAIPGHLYEAARMEGASGWQEFWKVTLPLLKPSMLLVVVLSTFGGFNLFIEPYVMTGGGPMGSTMSAVLYMYKHAFTFQHMGYASTIGLATALIILVAVVIEKKYLDTESYF